MQTDPAEIAQTRQRLYQSLSEKDRRRYAAVEALKLGGVGNVISANCLDVMMNRCNWGWQN